MQVKIQRSQRASITNTIIFCLDIRADYTAEEQHNIQKYKLGPQGIYNSRAAQKHLDAAGAHLDQTQTGTTGQRFVSLVKGATSLAISKFHLNVTIASIAKGHHIECKDMAELLEAEDTLRNACKDLTRYLEVANTFDGSELVVTYENGEEHVHVATNAPPLLTGPDAAAASADTGYSYSASDPSEFDPLAKLGQIWGDPFYRKAIYVGGIILLLILLLRSCV